MLTTVVAVDEGDLATLDGNFTPGWNDISADLGTIIEGVGGDWSWQFQTIDDGPTTPINVTATYPNTSTESATFDLVVSNVSPTLSMSGMSATNEGATYELTLEGVSDPGTDIVTNWIVDWGDGTVDDFTSAGLKTHVYDDGVSLQTIVVDLEDEDGVHPSAATLNVMVYNVPPTVSANASTVSVPHGETATMTGTSSDPGDDTISFNASVGTITPDGIGNWDWSYEVPLSAPPEQTVTVTATDEDGDSSITTFALLAGSITADQTSVTIDEGEFAIATGTFTVDPSNPVTLTSSVGKVVITGPGTWAWFFESTDGPSESQTVAITGMFANGPIDTTDITLTVNNVAPTIVAEGPSVTAPEGQIATFSGTFHDFGDSVTLSASIGNVVAIDNVWFWTLDTTDDAATQTVVITATDDESASSTATFDFTATNVAPFVDPTVAEFAEVGVPFNLSFGATIDAGDDTVTTWTIDWGDGVVESFPNAAVRTHTYTGGPTTATIRVDLTDEDGLHKSAAVLEVPVVYVWDNSDPTVFTEEVGTWSTSSNAAGFIGTDYAFNSKGNKIATFSAPVPTTGLYNVYLNWTSAGNRATDTRIDVTHATGVAREHVDQTVNGGQWNLIGTYEFVAGITPEVKVRTRGTDGGIVVADAVRIELVEELLTYDNLDTAFSIDNGTWFTSSTQAGLYGTDYRYAEKGNKIARFEPQLPSAGQYEVFARWTSSGNRATDARFDIIHADGTSIVRVDQTINGGEWVSLGEYEFASNQPEVLVRTRGADGIVVADAVRFDKTADLAIWDNADASVFSIEAGTWNASTNADGFLGEDYSFANGGDQTALFTDDIAQSGTYDVFAYWPSHPNRATNVPIEITHTGGTSTEIVDQTINGGMWNLIGSYEFDVDTAPEIRVRTLGTNGVVTADAFRLKMNKTLALSLSETTISEAGGTATGTITRSAVDLSDDLQVSISVDDLTEASAPASVTIFAGETTATFPITGVDDELRDATQVAAITVSATDYLPAASGSTATINVTSDDLAAVIVGYNQAKVFDDADATADPDIATTGEWGIATADDSQFVYLPDQNGAGSGLSRFDIVEQDFVAGLRGNGTGIYESTPANWHMDEDDFGSLGDAFTTDYGTVLTGELAGNGRLFEWNNPQRSKAEASDVAWRSAIPSVSHQGIATTPNGDLYFVDSDESGSIYKFVPTTPGDLSSGQTFVLSADAYAVASTATESSLPWDDALNAGKTRTGVATWVPITDLAGTPLTTEDPFDFTARGGRLAADEIVGTPFGTPQGIAADPNGGLLYVATASEDIVYSIDISTTTPTIASFVDGSTIDNGDTLPVGGDFAQPISIAVDELGNVFVAEGTTLGDIWIATDSNVDGVAESIDVVSTMETAGGSFSGLTAADQPLSIFATVTTPSEESIWRIDGPYSAPPPPDPSLFLDPLSTFGVNTEQGIDPVTGRAFTRYWAENEVLILHDDSGQQTSYSPSGRWMGVNLAISEQWLLIDRETGLGRISHNKGFNANGFFGVNSVIQWTERDTLLVVAGNEVREQDPLTGAVLRTLALTTPDSSGADFNVWRSGESTGQRWLYISHEKFENNELFKTIAVIDSRDWTLKYQYAFDQNVHQDDATQDRWRHLYFADETFYLQLDFTNLPNSPHHMFNMDGTGWQQMDNLSTAFPLFQQQDLSHTAFNLDLVAATNTSDPFIYIADNSTFAHNVQTIDLRPISRTTLEFYRHGSFGPNGLFVFAALDTTDDSDEAIYLVEPQTGELTQVAALDHLFITGAYSFLQTARPQMTHDQIAWHSNEVDRALVEIYTMDLLQ